MKNFSLSLFAVTVCIGLLCLFGSACGGGGDGGMGPAPTPSLNGSDWAYYQQGNVSSNAYCGYLDSYTMKLTLHYGPGNSSDSDIYLNYSCREDFGDVRFTEGDGETALDYWIQKYIPGVNATVWVEFRGIQDLDTSFYVFYGNLDAESASNGKSTFMIFNDGSSMDGWTVYKYQEYHFDWKVVSSDSNKVIRCTSVTSGGWSNLYWNASIGTDYYVAECKIRAERGLTNDNYQQGFSYYTNSPRVVWIDNKGTDYWDLRDHSGSTHSQPDATFNAAQWHDYSFVKDNNSWELYVDDELKVTRNAGPVGQFIGMYANFLSANRWAEFDDFRVRQYCSPEPEFGAWGEPVLIGEPIVIPTLISGTPKTGSTHSTIILTDGAWELRVDRAWDGHSGSIQFPSDQWGEANYQPVLSGTIYRVVFSEQCSQVSIGDQPVEGLRTAVTDENITYDLINGTFAGGRFVVLASVDDLQAELTIYGSGVPIVSSERGDLVPAP